MVIDQINQPAELTPILIATLAKRNTGVGFDQCLLLEPSSDPNIDFFYRIFNANGNEVGQCGNGARCIGRFAHYRGLTTKNTLRVATKTTELRLKINADKTVTVTMEPPLFSPETIPFLAPTVSQLYPLTLPNGEQCHIEAINVGNPHALLVVSDIDHAPVASLGKNISEHPQFPEETNVGFMQIKSSTQVLLRVYERGCGETMACGSGAVAAVALGRLHHQLAARVNVQLAGGNLLVEWPSPPSGPIYLTGPATFVYDGKLILP